MATVILLRHGRTTANTAGVLAGRAGGVRLDGAGRAQAAAAAERLASVRLASVRTSPLHRCRETASPVAGAAGVPLVNDHGLVECDYGEWTGRPIKELVRDRQWRVVQRQPSAMVFPGGESLTAMLARAAEAVRRQDRAVEEEHGPEAVWLACTHGDVIKALLADALGLHLDLFQRIQVDPASVSLVRYTDERPYVLGVNTLGGDLGWLTPPKRRRGRRRTHDAVVGGGAGPATGPD